MKILALEFSSPRRSVAIVEARADLGPELLAEASEPGGRSTRAMGMIEEILLKAQLEREQIECIAIGLGPGSYNGVRAALAVAQGWQLAREVRLLGICSAESLAAQAQAEGFVGRAAVTIDAQRGEFYLAIYEITGTGCREIEPLRVVPLAEIQARAQAGDLVLGPEADKWVPTGKAMFPSAAKLGILAATRSDFVPGHLLEPIYLRETQFVKAPPPRVLPESLQRGRATD
jgi:tRNA threonylcarbamoyl adenosine modification protein YeaZ